MRTNSEEVSELIIGAIAVIREVMGVTSGTSGLSEISVRLVLRIIHGATVDIFGGVFHAQFAKIAH